MFQTTPLGRVIRRGKFQERRIWHAAPVWVGVAVVLGLVTDDLAPWLIRPADTPLSSSGAVAILSAIASGMIAFTGFVFSALFVILQFSATAYTPRLVREIGRHARLMGHAFGVFTGTFVYALLAIRLVELEGGRGTNTGAMVIALLWLIASIVLFMFLVPRVRTLSITHVLVFIDEAARAAIERAFSPFDRNPANHALAEAQPPVTQTLCHTGGPMALQSIDTRALAASARRADGVVHVPLAVGDVVMDGEPLLFILGAKRRVSERRLHGALLLGPDRALLEDPAYALRLLVDIAIRALSPAINDPTTAVQVLDRIQSLLTEIGRRAPERGAVTDADGRLRVVISLPTWEDYLALSLTEIMQYGSTSIQVQRRLVDLLLTLEATVPPSRQPAVKKLIAFQEADQPELFKGGAWLVGLDGADRQGLGHTIPRHGNRSPQRPSDGAA